MTGMLFLLVGYSVSCLSVVVQEFEFRRDIGAVRARIVALDAQAGSIETEDVVVAVRAVAAASGIEIDTGDIEVIAVPVAVRDRPGQPCSVAQLPSEFDRLSVEDRRRFDGAPIKCSETRWIIGFRADVRASSFLTSSRFTVERYTWVDGFRPGGGEVVAAR